MWRDTRLLDLFEIEHPIFQAPMAGSSTPAMAAAVCNSGGLGALAWARIAPDAMRAEAETLRLSTNRPFNVNFFATPATAAPSATDVERVNGYIQELTTELGATPPTSAPAVGAGYDDARHALVLELRPKVVSFHFGLPEPGRLAELADAGIKFICTATNVSEARFLENAGCSAIIAQGYEAGGHRGSHSQTMAPDAIGTMALVPQIVDAVSLPVVAAGGIADGRGIAAALALGASGVQIGSAFLRAEEAATDTIRRDLISKSDGSDTMMTAAGSGRPARAYRSDYAQAMAPHDGSYLPFGAQTAVFDALRNAAQSPERASFLLYGQAAGLAREAASAEIVRRLVAETQDAFARSAI